MSSPSPSEAKHVNSPINGYTILVAVIAALAGLLFGFDTGIISGAMLYIQPDFNLADHPLEEGLIVSAVVLGAIFGAAGGGKLADGFGRRRTVIVTAIIFALGSVASAFAPDPVLLIIGRIALGVAIGIASCVAPLYISEMAPPQIRGALVSLNQLMITIGIVAAYAVNLLFSDLATQKVLTGHEAWAWMLGCGAFPAVVLGIGMMLLPDSPRWLASRGRNEDAARTLRRIRGVEDVDTEMAEIKDSLKSEAQQTSNLAELAKPWLKPLLILGIGLGVFQQFSGINTVIYYAPTIFKFAGYESNNAAILATGGVGLFNVLMTVVAVFLMDRVGRRPLLLLGLAGMTLSLLSLGLAFHFHAPDASGALPEGSMLPEICLISLLAYVGSFAISLGPIFWLIISEIYPIKIRGMAMGLATMIQWVANFIITLTFLYLIHQLGEAGTFWVYSAITLIAWIFSWFLMPETKGVTLEDIEEHCRAGKPLRQLGKA